jgi:hypothetical protein
MLQFKIKINTPSKRNHTEEWVFLAQDATSSDKIISLYGKEVKTGSKHIVDGTLIYDTPETFCADMEQLVADIKELYGIDGKA